MKLYPKKLNSVEALKREKEVLKYAIKQTDATDYFPSLSRGNKKEKEKSSGVLPLIGDLLSSKSRLQMAMAVAKPIVRLFRKKKAAPKVVFTPQPPPHRKKNILKVAAMEIAGGYLKWKAIELGYKSVKKLIAQKKKKHTKKEE